MSDPDGYVMMCTQVSVPRSRDDIQFIWQGGDRARLYRGNLSFFEFDPYCVLSNHAPNVGDEFTYGDYTVRCVANTAEYIDVMRV